MKHAVVVAAASLLAVGASAAPLRNSRPNIIFVMTDDQGNNLSCMGQKDVQTPHIDQFAANSLRFTNYYVSPNCAPTRAALLSGVHEFRAAVTATHAECERMALDLTTFPQLLQKAGYTTGIFGKWHLGDEAAYRPNSRGFDEVLVHGAGGIGQREVGVEVTSYADFPPNQGEGKKAKYFDPVLLHNDTIVQTKGYCTDLFFHAALAWTKEQHDQKKPFFTYLSTNAPHSPLIAPQANLDRIKARGGKKTDARMAMIENIDDNFGLLMQKLTEWDMLDDTIVIWTTDNGAPGGGVGYKHGKGTPYEGGIHVPMFWYWKGQLQQNRDIDALAAHVDLYKTFCELTGADSSKAVQKLEGRSLLPLLENPTAKWEPRMLQTHRGNLGPDPRKAANKLWSVRTGRWHLVGKELYDIDVDPLESRDIAAQHPEVVDQLSKSHFEWFETQVPYMINQNNVWEGPAPYEALYSKQKKERGIPEWAPATID